MSERLKPKFLWFRISIVFGLMLGMLLLVQTVLTYRYVSRSLVRQQAQREADARMQSIGRAARLTGLRDSAGLTPVLRELVHEAASQVAWIRILNFDGRVVAESEPVAQARQYKAGQIGKLLGDRDRRPEERTTGSGQVFIIVSPMRFGPPAFARPADTPPPAAEGAPATVPSPVPAPEPQAGRPPEDNAGREGGRQGRGGGRGRGNPEVAEIAIYLDGVSANFGPLRQNLIVGCTASFALMAAVIVIGLRFRHYMRGRHMEEELFLARRVQLDLFPAEDSIAGNIQFAAKCVPAYQVGGDLYDVFEMDHGEVGLVLGDVSGKGLPAALLMGVVQGAVRASSVTGAAAHHEQAAERLNHLLCMKTARERFVSLFWCYFDQRAGVLRYVNAGHLPPLLIRQTANRQQQVIRLDSGGPVLGLLPGAHYTQAEVLVEPGDLLVVFSDGILEAANSRDEEFGEEGVLASVGRNVACAPREMCAAILADVQMFLGKELPQDDQTLLVVRLDPVPQAVPAPVDVAGVIAAT